MKFFITIFFCLFITTAFSQNSRYYKKHPYSNRFKSISFAQLGVPLSQTLDNKQYQPLLLIVQVPYNLIVYDKRKAAIDLVPEAQVAMVNIYNDSRMQYEVGFNIGVKPQFRFNKTVFYLQPNIGVQFISYDDVEDYEVINIKLSESIGLYHQIKSFYISSEARYRYLVESHISNLLFVVGVGLKL